MSERTVLDVMMDNIVNPRCDECGASVNPPNPLLGPHLCFACSERNRREFERGLADFESQERRDRRVHVVKLPEGMRRNHDR